MKRLFTIGLYFLLHPMLLAQNNQIEWTRNKSLHDGSGTGGLQLSAKDLYFNQMEQDILLDTHYEFEARATNVGTFKIPTNFANVNHATMVASLGAAIGVDPKARGIAYKATIRNYSYLRWPNLIEVINDPQTDIRQRLVINSSNGVTPEQGDPVIPILFGTYGNGSNTIDDLAWRNPYCLLVASACNNGQIINPEPNTNPQSLGYDKLPSREHTAKNTLVVGNAYEVILYEEALLGATIHNTSAAGPTDDMRVKPELVAPGCNLRAAKLDETPQDKTNQTYSNSAIGTSFASSIVAGTALLQQELYFTHNRQYMRAATVKGLLMHTADKILPSPGTASSVFYTQGISAMEGPDPFCGYGLVNGAAAARAILNRGISSIVDEKILLPDQSQVVNISTKAGQTVKVSISWTDPARYETNATFVEMINEKTPALLNDLDVVVLERLKFTPTITRRFYPYSYVQTASGISAVNDRPNRVDPYEKIRFVPQPDHVYSISISAENSGLWDGHQAYSLIVTGLGDEDDPIPTCEPTRVILEPVQVGGNEEASNQLTLSAEVMPQAGFTEFNAPNLLLNDGAFIHNSETLLYNAACSWSGLRQGAIPPTASSDTPSWLQRMDVQEGDLQLYPNPVGNNCRIISKETVKTVWIYSPTGQVVGQQAGHNLTDLSINTEALPAGQYVLLVEDELGQKKIKKMIKH